MLKDDPVTFNLIWLAIEGIRMITPLCVAITFIRFTPINSFHVPAIVDHVALVETLFYLLFFLPRRYALDALSPAFTHRSRNARRELFRKCIETVPDLDEWFSIWFKEVDVAQISRQDIKSFLAWGFLNKTEVGADDDEELEEYLRVIEKESKRKYALGSNQLMPCRVSTDRLCLESKPLTYYVLTVSIADTACHILMSHMSFKHYRLPMKSAVAEFPLRPLALLSSGVSPSTKLSYWYRPHTSQKCLPILFFHGIGVGLQIYTTFLQTLVNRLDETCDDGQVGILALEVMPISFRITGTLLPREIMVDEIRKILMFHGWTDFVIAAHSFGSIFATHLLRSLSMASTAREHPLILIDPVTLSIHFAEIPYNFIYRKPRTASELLCSFAATDIGVCPSIMRLFDWTQNVLWLDEITHRSATVFLAGRDVIIDAEKLRQYLRKNGFLEGLGSNMNGYRRLRNRKAIGNARIVFHKDYNHGEILFRGQGRQKLVEEVIRACHRKCCL